MFAQNSSSTVRQSVSTANSSCTWPTDTACAVFGVKGAASLTIDLDVATSGTFNFEATTDDQGTGRWFAIVDDVGATSTATADGRFSFTNPGYAYIRVRASAISGTASLVGIRGEANLRSTATLSGASGDGTIQDGANPAIEVTVKDYTNSNPVAAVIMDTNGDPITSFGGGTQYTNGSVQATPSGTVALGWDTANVRALSTTTSGYLNVVFPTTQNVTAGIIGVYDTGFGNMTDTTAHALKTLTVDASGVAIPADSSLGSAPTNNSIPVRITTDSYSGAGCTPSKLLSAATTNATSVKASGGLVFVIHAINFNAAARYLKLYNKASAPTVGTDTPIWTLPIPPNSTTGGGFVFSLPTGVSFSTGIAFALTTGIADADTGAVAANEIALNYCWK